MTFTTLDHPLPRPRKVGQALRRGFVGRCPACSEGHIFRAFLKVRDVCEACGEPLHHQRADDAPPYVTILVVAHVVGALMVLVLSADEEMPVWIQAILWPGLVLVLSLALLPRIKGALVALQWALRMHGFGSEAASTPQPSAPTVAGRHSA